MKPTLEDTRRQLFQQPDRVKALQEASLLPAREALSTLVGILEEIRDLISKNRSDQAEAHAEKFLQIAIMNLKENLEKMNIVNPFKILALLRSVNKEKILADLQLVVSASKEIEIDAETMTLWEQVSFWLKSIHKHTDDQVKALNLTPNPDGTLGPIDLEDRAFYTIFAMTKHSVAVYYLEMAAHLDIQINKYKETLKAAINKSINALSLFVTPKQNESPVENIEGGQELKR